jgi:hypothetical protein
MVDAPLSMTMTGARLMIDFDEAGCYSRRRGFVPSGPQGPVYTRAAALYAPYYLFWARVSYYSDRRPKAEGGLPQCFRFFLFWVSRPPLT